MNQPEGQDHEGIQSPALTFGSTSTSLAVIPVARVMSPNNVLQEGILDYVQAICQFCYTPVRGPSVCTGCGAYGHAGCLRLERFIDYHFCSTCIPRVAAEYASFQDAQRREAWRRSLDTQISAWRSRAIEAIGLGSTIGVAVGGAVVAAAGVAAGLAQGAVRGAAAASSGSQLALPSITHTPAPTNPSDPLGGRAGITPDSPVG